MISYIEGTKTYEVCISLGNKFIGSILLEAIVNYPFSTELIVIEFAEGLSYISDIVSSERIKFNSFT